MPVDRSAIDAQLREIGEGERWWEQREFRDLPYILNADERLHGVVLGKLLGARRPRVLPSAPWLVAATSQRLVCLREQRFGRQQVDIPLSQITGMWQRSRLRGVEITLQTMGRRFRLRVAKTDAFRFIGAISPLLPNAPAAAVAGEVPGGLRARLLPGPGAVTREEFSRVEAALERQEKEIERLQQHVEFLEKLLETRAQGAFSPGAGSSS